MDYKEFKKRIIEKFRINNQAFKEKDEKLIVDFKGYRCEVDLELIYAEVKKEKGLSIDDSYRKIMYVFEENYKKINQKVDWHRVYPVIRPKNFEDGSNMFHQDLFLDLDLYLVEDFDDTIRFIKKDDVEDEYFAVKKAFENLNRVEAYLVPLNEKSGIYYSLPENGFSAARIVTKKMQKQISSILGDSYLLLISDDGGFIVARNSIRNYRLLKDMTEKPDFEHRISKKIYTCENGMRFNYYNNKDIFRIIK
ncbi:DUF1444 family protein [Petrocella sp. FN5]|uniref:DUF1444 family protein n=1 Tax=Petrocella sp. FN5 TaxID=3032002 RepID=UPI0023DA18B8|nr:DUF1444 family protein [Petrocella sp. FN5]MDF1617300.1 DUF1444 family protein [Petrocella sp. FN5]